MPLARRGQRSIPRFAPRRRTPAGAFLSHLEVEIVHLRAARQFSTQWFAPTPRGPRPLDRMRPARPIGRALARSDLSHAAARLVLLRFPGDAPMFARTDFPLILLATLGSSCSSTALRIEVARDGPPTRVEPGYKDYGYCTTVQIVIATWAIVEGFQ